MTNDGLKKCSTCKEHRPVGEFAKDASRSDGLSYSCRQCQKEYRKHYKPPKRQPTEKDRERQRVRNKRRWVEMTPSERLEYNAQIRAYKAARREVINEGHRQYRRSNPDKVAAYNAARRQGNPEAVSAKNAVNNAIYEGKMPRVSTRQCADCGKQAQHYHHESYAPEHWLDVVPLCASCHKMRHQKSPAKP